MGKKKHYEAPFYVFWKRPTHPIRITIPDGFRLVVFSYGQSPSHVPSEVMSSGTYEVEPEPLPGADYPVALQVVDLSYVPMIEKLSAAKVNEIFDAVRP